MKSTHFSNRDSLKDAVRNLGLKPSDIDMSNKREPMNMSVSDVVEKPMNFKRGGKVMGISVAIMPAHKMNRMKKPCMSKGGMPAMNMGGMMPADAEGAYRKGGMAKMPADKIHRSVKVAKSSTKGYNKGGAMYAEGGLTNTKSISSSKLMSKAIKKSR